MKNKTELIELVKKQTNIELANDDLILNKKRKILYTQIFQKNKIQVLSLLQKHKIHYEKHVDNYYFIYL